MGPSLPAAFPFPLVEGSIFANEFRVLRPLAAGAMGAVYAVEQWRTGHQRALKVMLPGLTHDARMRARFLQEATVGSRIKSEHVVHVVDAGIDADTSTPWIAMEMLEGADLARVLTLRGPLPQSEVREIFAQLCHAVDAAHEAGVVHRDLKPQNIFLADTRREGATVIVKVLDFGIAKLVAEASAEAFGWLGSQPTELVGTPSWMAPEQSELGHEITPATDVWALGLLAFALLTASHFWRSVGAVDPLGARLLREMLVDPIPPASERAATLGVAALLPAGFDDWLARCLARAPSARFPRARDARIAFDALVFEGAFLSAGATTRKATIARTTARTASLPEPPTVRVRPLSPAHGSGEIADRRSSTRILLIDDSLADQLLIGHDLSEAGFVVLTADTGEDGVRRALADAPALILLDFLLPDIDAPEVLRRLRAVELTRDVPVILLTGTDLASHIAEGFQAGAGDYVMKPVETRWLIERIQAALTALPAPGVAAPAPPPARPAARHGRLAADLAEARAEQELILDELPTAWGNFWVVGGVARSNLGQVGGDMIGLYKSDAGTRTLAVIDVPGHGAAAALVGASVRAALGPIVRTRGPAEALTALNRELISLAAPRHACVVLVRIVGRTLTIANAGMPPVVLARGGIPASFIGAWGMPPGLFPDETYSEETYTVAPGDRLAIVSNGLLAPFGAADAPLQMLDDLSAFDAARWTGREQASDVVDRLRAILAEVAQPDDATFVLLHTERPR
jgi:serine/threonine protein kinase/DNA-binding response OmpR family regulator